MCGAAKGKGTVVYHSPDHTTQQATGEQAC